MAWLLYCVTSTAETVSLGAGVCDSAVHSQELLGLRVHYSDIENVEACLGNAESLKKAALQFHQMLRDMLSVTTPIPFRFPTLVEGEEALVKHLEADAEGYRAALERLRDVVQYEIVGSWTADAEADLATPVSGREYLKRRQEASGRIAAVDTKLRAVAADSVREWRARQERRSHRWFALVPRANRDRFIASLRGAGASEGVRLRLTGPWPPSEFLVPGGEGE